jgi:hypothetical protein
MEKRKKYLKLDVLELEISKKEYCDGGLSSDQPGDNGSPFIWGSN